MMRLSEKCLNVRQKLGNRKTFKTLKTFKTFTLSFTLSQHAEQLLFSCLCLKVTLTLSHSLTLILSHSLNVSLSHFHYLIHSLSTC